MKPKPETKARTLPHRSGAPVGRATPLHLREEGRDGTPVWVPLFFSVSHVGEKQDKCRRL
nr:hypothetical protein [Candidatus Freyarchaeota archaeon]